MTIPGLTRSPGRRRLEGVDWLALTLGASCLRGRGRVGGYAVVHVMRSYGRVLVRLEQIEEQLRDAGFDLDEPDDVPPARPRAGNSGAGVLAALRRGRPRRTR